jgi:hypothetical protein
LAAAHKQQATSDKQQEKQGKQENTKLQISASPPEYQFSSGHKKFTKKFLK